MQRITLCGLSALILVAVVLGGCASTPAGTMSSPPGAEPSPQFDGVLPYGT
jgi:hypothetical protein